MSAILSRRLPLASRSAFQAVSRRTFTNSFPRPQAGPAGPLSNLNFITDAGSQSPDWARIAKRGLGNIAFAAPFSLAVMFWPAAVEYLVDGHVV